MKIPIEEHIEQDNSSEETSAIFVGIGLIGMLLSIFAILLI
jgi:hypothetical protein